MQNVKISIVLPVNVAGAGDEVSKVAPEEQSTRLPSLAADLNQTIRISAN